MRLIFIRHGDPDYRLDTLTPKGWREAELLSCRLMRSPADYYYGSPLGRARDTASCTLKRLGRTMEIFPWLQEFPARIIDPQTGRDRIPWDFMPVYRSREELFYDRNAWVDAPVMKTGPVRMARDAACTGLDALLTRHGYVRKEGYYRVARANTDTLVFFCHLGITCALAGHLLGISAPVMWHGFYLAPTSLTEFVTEEREKGTAAFRCVSLGDTRHLYDAGEPYSCVGLWEEACM